MKEHWSPADFFMIVMTFKVENSSLYVIRNAYTAFLLTGLELRNNDIIHYKPIISIEVLCPRTF